MDTSSGGAGVTPEYVERYARHLVLKEIGGAGQRALSEARVALVGAGGLGGPAALYLAAAGVGHLTLIDDDHIERSNLQRQIQFQDHQKGQSKAHILAEGLRAQNPDVKTRVCKERLSPETAKRLLEGHELILDGVDTFESRFEINAASLSLQIPLLSGALGRWDGQVAAFRGTGIGPCYQCLVPEIPPNARGCSELGVVGALAGLIGSSMALEAIKILVGAGDSLFGRVFVYDGLATQARSMTLHKDPDCRACGPQTI